MSKPYLIIHHSGDVSEFPQFHKINVYHQFKGFPLSSLGRYCGYHFVVEHDGQVVQARELTDRGAHTNASCGEGPENHCNLVGIGVCMAGDFTKEQPGEAQLQALYDLWKALSYPKVVYHSDVKKTSCPGDFNFRNALTALYYADLKQRLSLGLRALPRLLGTLRGSVLQRQVERLKKLLGVE